jgi:hypothetical protein
MIAIALFFNLQMPKKIISVLNNQKAVLEDQVGMCRTREEEQQKFTAIIDSTKNMIDSLGKNKNKDLYLKNLIQRQLNEMEIQSKMTRMYGDMNKLVVSVLTNYNEDKTELLNLKDAADKIKVLTDKLKESEGDRKQAERDLDGYRKAATPGL